MIVINNTCTYGRYFDILLVAIRGWWCVAAKENRKVKLRQQPLVCCCGRPIMAHFSDRRQLNGHRSALELPCFGASLRVPQRRENLRLPCYLAMSIVCTEHCDHRFVILARALLFPFWSCRISKCWSRSASLWSLSPRNWGRLIAE